MVPVLGMCVPPQNSTESSGVASSGFSGPISTTRTGSGYFSPNTARTPGTFFACSSGNVIAVTDRSREMSWFTRPWLLCIPLHRSGLGGFDVLQFFCVSKWHVLGVRVSGGKALFTVDGSTIAKDVALTYKSGYVGLLASNSKVAFDDVQFMAN